MKKRAICAILLAGLGACASDARWNRFEQTEAALMQARECASVDCSGIEECTQRWERTREYVVRYSATLWNRQVSARVSGSREGMCKGMYAMDGGPSLLYAQCAAQIRSIETNFRGFVLAPVVGPADDAA